MFRIARTAVAGALVVVAACPAAADVRAGVEAYARGDYAAAIREWRPFAERGDADAQFNLAQAYRLGRGVTADREAALDLYRKAAAQDHQEAGALLGLVLFETGRRAEAMPWLAKAAEGGDPAAQYVYGTALFNGDLVVADWPRAYALMTRAAAQGLTPARQVLVEMDREIPADQRRQGTELAQRAPVPPAPVRVATAAPVTATPAIRTPLIGAPPLRTDAGPPARPTTSAPASATRSASVAAPAGAGVTWALPAPAARPLPTTPPAGPTVSDTPIAGWKIQLGAFSQAAAGNALFASLQPRVRALAGVRASVVRAGAVTRLQAGPFPSRAAAIAACAAVRAQAALACFPVAP